MFVHQAVCGDISKNCSSKKVSKQFFKFKWLAIFFFLLYKHISINVAGFGMICIISEGFAMVNPVMYLNKNFQIDEANHKEKPHKIQHCTISDGCGTTFNTEMLLYNSCYQRLNY